MGGAARRVRDYLEDPNWERADILGEISASCPEMFQLVGRRGYPLYVTPPMSMDVCDLWRIVCMRRRGRNNWNLIPPLHTPQPDICTLRNFWEVVPKDIDRDRRRGRRANISPISEEPGPTTLA